MTRLGDIMTTDVVTVTPQTRIREALELFARRHVGGAPVVSNGKVVGVVSATDLMNLAAALPGVPTQREESEAVTSWEEPSLEDEVEEEAEPSSAYFSGLWDDAGVEVTERLALDSPEWNALEEHEVSEAMTLPPLITLPPNTEVVVAAATMARYGIHRVLVVEGDTLVGIVSTFDITRAVADGRVVRRVFVFNPAADFADQDV